MNPDHYSLIPRGELARARRSILDYCKENRIPTVKNKRGDICIEGREHLVISGSTIINQKSRIQGSLIDLVAAHRGLSYLQAVAHINDNRKLLLIEQAFGAVEHHSGPFSVPKKALHSSAPRKGSVTVFTHPKDFVRQHGDDVFGRAGEPSGILALFGLDPEAVDAYVAQHPHVKRLEFAPPKGGHTPADLDFFGVLKNRYRPRGIEIGVLTRQPELSRGGPDLDL
jgi:hypothetical protein